MAKKTSSESASGENEPGQFARRRACDSSLLTKDMPAIPAPLGMSALLAPRLGSSMVISARFNAGFGARPLDQCGGALT